ncbi:MAG: hypothetical protein KIT84_16615 [Labilithrix sp.]|nr:hypothetical protein [Labilithrix sp.]MCW5812654.1 hypothetical protein [Labilithrix sp.]
MRARDVVLAAAVLGGPVAIACRRGDSAEVRFEPGTLVSDAGTFTRAELLAGEGACALDTYRRTKAKADVLADALRAWDAAPSDATKAAARAAFAETMTEFQRAEAMQFGPFARAIGPGGEGIRDQVYMFPDPDRCLMDDTLANEKYLEPELRSVKTRAGARGLATIEYLLFYEGAANACPATAAINTEGTWAGLAPAELTKRRAAYARVVGEDVAARLGDLVQRWEPSGGNFLAELETAGSGSRVFASQQGAINALTDALFYLDKELKDDKVGRALGEPELVEAPHSRLGHAYVAANLAGFRAIFFGCGVDGGGLGFDDLLEGVGAGRVAASAAAAFAEVEATFAKIPAGTFEDALAARSAEAQAFHAALKKLADILKTEVVTVLNLELPSRVEGDND